MSDREIIQQAFAAVTDTPLDVLLEPCHDHTRALARHAVMKYLREKWHWSHERIGRAMNRNHSSVVYGAQHFTDLLDVKDTEAVYMWKELGKL